MVGFAFFSAWALCTGRSRDFCRRLRRRKKASSAIMAAPAKAPITMPAIAPPEMPEDEEEEGCVEATATGAARDRDSGGPDP